MWKCREREPLRREITHVTFTQPVDMGLISAHLLTFVFTCTIATSVGARTSLLAHWLYIWAGFHSDGLGLDRMRPSTCEMRTRGEGDRQRRAPSRSHQASHRQTWHFMMVWWCTHIKIPSLTHALPFFLFEPDSHTIRRVTCSARHVWPHHQENEATMRWACMAKKNIARPTPVERFSNCNKEAVQYNNSIVYCDVCVLLFFVCVFLLQLCILSKSVLMLYY